jgi:phospholipid/cholesterol/gamma-HCH transport system substrate-binding protein
MTTSHLGRKAAVLVAFLAVCAAVFSGLYALAGGRLPLAEDRYEVAVVLPDPFQLVANADVRAAGVRIGKVQRIEPRGAAGVVHLAIERRYAPIHRDARVRLRTKTLVGENYLEVDPGTAAAGAVAEGDALPLDHAGEAVQLDRILSTLDRRTRAEVQRNLDALGPGVDGRGADVGALFAALRPTVGRVDAVAGVLRGQRDALADLADQTGRVLAAFGRRSAAVRTLATQARRAADAAAARDVALGRAIDALPATLEQAAGTSRRLAGLSRTGTPTVRALAASVATLRPVVDDLGPAAVQGRRLLRELPPFLRRADPLLDGLRGLADQALPAVDPTRRLVAQLEPLVGHLAPYRRELGAFFAAVGSTTQRRDGVGHYLRVQQYYSPTSLSLFTPEMRRALEGLTHSGLVAPFTGEHRNAYPAPGRLQDPGPFGDGPAPEPPAGR